MKKILAICLALAVILALGFLPACSGGGGGGGSGEEPERGNQLWGYAPGAGYVFSVNAPGGAFTCTTGQDGTCRIRGIPSGVYQAQGTLGGVVRGRQNFTWTGADKHQFRVN